ncbi:MAG TPA: cyclic nucleotide-binding domain-containing protein [Candidatus Limnocylindrales bacterium]|nr:cyclic nucleotide-binding domain-containing protein [Candidatus Limnocylindrales bacterium]
MATRFESSVTSISWIPSEAITGPSKIPFELGVTHYDETPPDHLDDLEALRTSDRFREANELRAFVEVDDGRIVGYGHLGQGYIGATTVRVGPAAVRFAAVQLPDLQPEPEVSDGSVRFVQTVGGRMGLPTPRPVPHKPFVQLWPSIAWTTLALTINADGSSSHELVGASPFPRHWIYDRDGKLVQKTGVVDFAKWAHDAFGERTPWGAQDSPAIVTAVETELERSLHSGVMRGSAKPQIRSIKEGDTLVKQGETGTEVFLILDGMFVVEADGNAIAEVGPGAIVGERASLQNGTRTATLWARTPGRVASVPADALDHDALASLGATRRREE